MVYFISGHLDLTQDEFIKYYIPQLIKARRECASFVVGDARGADLHAQVYFARWCCETATTVYHMFDSPRHNVDELFTTIGGFTSDNERDAAMTNASDADIAWVRPGREKSGTAKNLQRRMKC